MKFIDTPELLKEASQAIAASPWAAMDTEADSLHHYVEKLCLLQISIPDEDYVIDPLIPLDLHPLTQILSKKPLILHGADFDIRILKRFYGFMPREIFDTMIAAQLLGYEKQGLADLVERHFGHVLSKTSQKADWAKRPLEDKLIDYAWKDTHYLKVISFKMQEELASKGRAEWQQQACTRLLKTLSLSVDKKVEAEHAWQIKGAKNLNGRGLAILKALWSWREEMARHKDRPSFKVLHSELLVEIAQWASEQGGEDVAQLPNAPRNLKGDHRDVLNRVLREAKASPELRYFHEKKAFSHGRLNAESSKRMDALKEAREKIGQELKIQPSLLATNATLQVIAIAAPKNQEAIAKLNCLMPWQAQLLAESILIVSKS